MKRAYSLLTIKAVDDEKRLIEGIATTPTPDRMNDIVELDGISFSLPLPFLYQHNTREPIGQVIEAQAVNDQMQVKIQMAPSGIADFIDKAWNLIKAGLVQGLSIGFRPIEEAYNRDTGGYHYIKSEWYELSAVTIPANAEANITSVKSADALLLAASGPKQNIVRLDMQRTSPGVPGTTRNTGMTIKEQITQFENKRAATVARLDELIARCGAEGRVMIEAEATEHDALEAEIQQIDEHLRRLKMSEARMASQAQAVPQTPATPQQRAATTPITVVPMTAKGIGFARAIIALGACKGNRYEAAEQARKHWPDMGTDLEMLIKAEQLPGTTSGTTWAGPLMQSSNRLVGEFIEMLRPAMIIGRVPNLRRVPFNITVPLQSGGGTYTWVGENRPKPVSGLTLGTAVLRLTKIAGIIPFTKEALRLSDPSIEARVRDDMIKGTARYADTQFVDPSVHESIGVQPASITDQIVNTAASGLTSTAFRNDMRNIIGKFITNNEDPAMAVILMSATVASNLASMMNALGQPEFPGITMQGGNYMGIPIIVSQNVGSRVILFNPDDILIAEDPGGTTIDVSEEASVVMTTTPESSPQATELVSFWQNNLIGLRVDLWITWKRARTQAVEYISGASYSG